MTVLANEDEAQAEEPDNSRLDLPAIVGHHLRRFRKDRGETLRSVAAASGLSIGFLSQLERGQTSISLVTLRDLAACLDRQITDFFEDPSNKGAGNTHHHAGNGGTDATQSANEILVPADEEKYFTITRGTGEDAVQYISGSRTYRLLSQRAPGLLLEPLMVYIAPGGRVGEDEVHHGEEFAYVLSGTLTFTVNGVSHKIHSGDSLHLLSAIPHKLSNDTDDVVVVVSVVTPRLF